MQYAVQNHVATHTLMGSECPGNLNSVLMHMPGSEMDYVSETNYYYWNFDRMPDKDRYIGEHQSLQHLLHLHGITIYDLEAYVDEYHGLLNTKPTIRSLHDIALIAHDGAILSHMNTPARKHEEAIVKEALTNLGVPILYEFSEIADAFEGCLFLSEDTLFIIENERYHRSSVSKFIRAAVQRFTEVIYTAVSDDTRFLHPHMICNRIRQNLLMAYLPAFTKTYLFGKGFIEPIDFIKHMAEREIEVIPVSDEEQENGACSFLMLDNKKMINFDVALNKKTIRELSRHGIEFIPFRAQEFLISGDTPYSLVLELHRGNSSPWNLC